MIQAIIDLGSNTFQLLIAQISDGKSTILEDESYVSKIGQGGISQGFITPEATQRAIVALQYFKTLTDKYNIEASKVKAFGTSAVRNAKNQQAFIDAIAQNVGFEIEVIAGNQEAQLIYEGVKFGGSLSTETSLIMDIGGGSVEFVLCNQKRIFWKQSFELGGQRLMDKFMDTDPIAPQQIAKLYGYLDEQLLDLTNAIHQYQPEILVGSAGSFETLNDMFLAQQGLETLNKNIVSILPISSFRASYQKIVSGSHPERLVLAGMKAFRADMIVVGVILIDYILKKHSIHQIKVSEYALKEGVLSRLVKTF